MPQTPQNESTALTSWQEELAREAAQAAEAESASGGGTFFSTRAGQLAFGGSPIPGNQIACVILDSVYEHVYYEGEYDADNPVPPTCFALGREEAKMTPPAIVDQYGKRQHAQCAGCPQAEWGTSNRGRGKACRHTRRLALLGAGTLRGKEFAPFDDPEAYQVAGIGLLRLPVTSVKNYAMYVKQVAARLERPLRAVYSRVWLEPDPKTQFQVRFEALDKVPESLLAVLDQRRKEAAILAEQGYQLTGEERPAKAAPQRKKGAKY